MAVANIWPVYDVAANGQPLARLPGGTVVNVSYTSTHNETAAFTDSAIVGWRIKCDTASWFLATAAGTVATTSNGIAIAADSVEYFAKGGQSTIFSFVTA